MAVSWHIREATPGDAAELQSCMESAYAAYQGRMGGKRLPPMKVDYLSEIKDYPTWVVELYGSIVGGLILVFEDNHASIANIAVDPKFQGQGIGGGLMRLAESKAREENCSEMHLVTHVLLNENISLYRHLGWKEADRDESRVYMKKEI